MNEDAAAPRDREALEDERREAFAARFPPEAFAPIAAALGFRPTPANVEALKRWLLPWSYQFFHSCTGKEPSRARRIAGLKQLRDAAADLRGSLWVAFFGLPIDLLHDVLRAEFRTTVEQVRQEADASLQKLASVSARRGRPPKTAFRDYLVEDLVRIYEALTKNPARKPYWSRNTKRRDGPFYRFACAVQQSLRAYVPEVRDALPKTDEALADELHAHWPRDNSVGRVKSRRVRAE
jgi:hypothetical protein